MDTNADKCAMFKDCFKDNTFSFRFYRVKYFMLQTFIQTTALCCILLYRQILLVEDYKCSMLQTVVQTSTLCRRLNTDKCSTLQTVMLNSHRVISRQELYFVECYTHMQEFYVVDCYIHNQTLCAVDCSTDMQTVIQTIALCCGHLYRKVLYIVFCYTDKCFVLYSVTQTNT